MGPEKGSHLATAAVRLTVVGIVLLQGIWAAAAHAAPPTATTRPATQVSGQSALLQGRGTPQGEAATGFFRLGTTQPAQCNGAFGSRVPSAGGTALGQGNLAVDYSITASGLLPGRTYYFCAAVTNASGTAFGSVESFFVPASPVVATGEATAITSAEATLAATAEPEGAATVGYFRWTAGTVATCNDTFGTRSPAVDGVALGSGTSTVAYTISLTGLSPGTRYSYCALARNSVGVSTGTVRSFQTLPAPPTMTTLEPQLLGAGEVVLQGTIQPGGAESTGYFRYSTANPGVCNAVFGTRAPAAGGDVVPASLVASTYSEIVTGMAPSTTYYVCALGQNVAGASVGTVLSFTTPGPPVAQTAPASGLSDVTATLHGTVTPNRAATTGFFRYATTHPGSCDEVFGRRVPSNGGTALGSGSEAIAFSQTVTGLSPATTYYFCVLATNSEGAGYGEVQSFTTPSAPVTTTQAATGVTSSQATLHGLVSPGGAAATGAFRFAASDPGVCNDAFGTRVPATGGVELGAGVSGVAFSQPLTGLLPATTYFFCALATNTYGTTPGSLMTFTTPASLPTVTTSASSSLTSTAGVLGGVVNPGGAATTAWIRYSTANPGACNDTFGTRQPLSGGTALQAGLAAQTFSQTIVGLSPSTTYYYCALAENSVGQTRGNLLSFVTPARPTATTLPASAIQNTSLSLNGSANPNRAAAIGYFRYSTTNPLSCNDSFGTRVPESGGVALGNGSAAATFSQAVAGLTPNTLYFFCAIAANAEGVGFGTPLTARTSAPPTTTTNTATSVTPTTATLNGAATPNGSAATAYFRYATSDPGECNDSFGVRAPTQGGAALGGGGSSVSFSNTIAGLLPGTTYFFCALANNAYGTTTGIVRTLMTPAAAPTLATTTPLSLTSSTVTLRANIISNGSETTAWFRFSNTSPGACNNNFGTRSPGTGGLAVGSLPAAVTVEREIQGLLPSTTYFACTVAQNGVGTTVSNLISFTTSAGPLVTTMAPTEITDQRALLLGSAVPNRSLAVGYFRYSTTDPGACDDVFGERTPSLGAVSLGDGAVAAPFEQAAEGLAPGTTYFFCAIAQNAEGIGYGLVQSFRTLTGPTVTTGNTTSIAARSVTLQGAANPQGAATTGYFRLSTNHPGACNDSFGARHPADGGAVLGSGTSAVNFTQAVTGLLPATTYHSCALATNAYGLTTGELVTWTTLAAPPTLGAQAATASSTSAQVGVAVNPGGAATTTWFRYASAHPGACNDAFGARFPATGGSLSPAGVADVVVGQSISGLTPATTYFFCAVAENAAGVTLGTIGSFTTSAAPTVTTLAATGIRDTQVTLQGNANPNRASTTGYFRLGTLAPATCDDTYGQRVPATGGIAVGSGAVSANFSFDAQGLSPATTYSVCAVAENAEGRRFGTPVSVTTTAAPAVSAQPPVAVTATTASLQGFVTPRGGETTAFFRYGLSNPGVCNDGFGTRAPAAQGTNVQANAAATAFTQDVTGLVPATTYFVCAGGTNPFGTAFSTVISFTTLPAAPIVSTGAVSQLTSTSAQLSGTVNPGGASTVARFRFSTTNPGECNDEFGTAAPFTGGVNVGAGSNAVSFTQPIVGLLPATTYFSCALAVNEAGLGRGEVLSWTTPAAPTVSTLPAADVRDVSAILAGSANPNRSASTGYFRYGLFHPGVCDDSFGVRVPTMGGTSLGDGTTPTDFTQAVANLPRDTVIYYCAWASNAEGVGAGPVLSFRTATSPTVTTMQPTTIEAIRVTLAASASANGGATTGYFRVAPAGTASCNDVFGTRVPATDGVALGDGRTAQDFTQVVDGLLPGTSYVACALATNAYGTTPGALVSFTTAPTTPKATTTTPVMLRSTSATLTASGHPGGASAAGFFRLGVGTPAACSEGFGLRVPAVGEVALGAGIEDVPFSVDVTGLTPNTTYSACAVVQNSVGTGLGTPVTLQTTAAPSVTTLPAQDVAGAATFLGQVNPNGATTTAYFRYASTNPESCSEAFGTRAPSGSSIMVGAGRSDVVLSTTVTSLRPSTTYYFCAIAQNSEGVHLGTLQSFTTPAVPGTTTMPASPVSSDAATLQALVHPQGLPTTAYFRFSDVEPAQCDDRFGARAPDVDDVNVGDGSSEVPTSVDLTGLLPGVTYFFCALAENALGLAFGEVLSFTTPASLPVVTTLPATDATPNTAMLRGLADPRGGDAVGWFRLFTTQPATCEDVEGTRIPSTGGVSLGTGNVGVPFAQPAAGLVPLSTVYVCAFVQNEVGTTAGSVVSLRVPDAPRVATDPVTQLASTSATLNGTVHAAGMPTSVHFRLSPVPIASCGEEVGTRVPAVDLEVSAGFEATSVTIRVEGLEPGRQYFVCAIARNAFGSAVSNVGTFRSLAGVPVATTADTVLLSSTSAQLQSVVDPSGAPATAWFRVDTVHPGTCNDSFGIRVPAAGGVDVDVGGGGLPITQRVTGLLPQTKYFVCALATNEVGTSTGVVESFFTPDVPDVDTHPATDILATSTVLTGSVTPLHAPTSAWFRVYTSPPTACDDATGVRVPASGGVDVGDGGAPVSVALAMADLTPGVAYYFCLLAENFVGKSAGPVLSWTTPAIPIVQTVGSALVTATSAVLEGQALPNFSPTTGFFLLYEQQPEDCTADGAVRVPATGGTELGDGSNVVDFTTEATGLLPGATYFFCAVASNSVGDASGALLSFTTAAAPVAFSVAPTEVTSTTVRLQGEANPNRASAIGYFRVAREDPVVCDDNTGVRVPAVGGTDLGSGSSSMVFSETLTGLSPATTYFFCAVAQNDVGVVYGDVLSWTTPAAPSAVTAQAIEVTPKTARLTGAVNPRLASTMGAFRMGTSAPVTCDDSFGTLVPDVDGAPPGSFPGVPLGAGGEFVEMDVELFDLQPRTTYFFCARAQNEYGTEFGGVAFFTTPPEPAPPSTTTLVPTTSSVAVLRGRASPNLREALGYFRVSNTPVTVCDELSGERVPASGGVPLGAGVEDVEFEATIETLGAGSTFFVCAFASNALGTTVGAVVSFTMPTPPVAVTLPASDVRGTQAVLAAMVDPRHAHTQVQFRVGTMDPGFCDESVGELIPPDLLLDVDAESGETHVQQQVTGLVPNTNYFFCVVAQNVMGTATGPVLSFRTPDVPEVTTLPASAVTSTAATLMALAAPRGAPTEVFFRWDTTEPLFCDDHFGHRVPSEGGISVGGAFDVDDQPAEVVLDELLPGTTYFFCALAQSSEGLVGGEVLSLTTHGPPRATATAALDVTVSTATLTGVVSARGETTRVSFRIGSQEPPACSADWGEFVAVTGSDELAADFAEVDVSAAVSGLLLGTTYFFCVQAENALGTSLSNVMYFTTPTAPTVTDAAVTAVSARTARITGFVDPNRAATSAWFRLSSVDPGTCNDGFGVRVPSLHAEDGVGIPVGSGDEPVAVTRDVGSLAPGTTYFGCVIAENDVGKVFGEIVSFTTVGPPLVRLEPMTDITDVSVTLHGTAEGEVAGAVAWFRIAGFDPIVCDDAIGARLPLAGGIALAMPSSSPFSVTVPGLQSGRRYWVCAYAQNDAGIGAGVPQSFVTAEPPTLTGLAVEALEARSATVRVTVSPGRAPTGVWLRWTTTPPAVCDDLLGTRTPVEGFIDAGDGGPPVTVQVDLTGLAPATTYFVCAFAHNEFGTAEPLQSTPWTTLSAPPDVVTVGADATSATTATLAGTVATNGAATTAWFFLTDQAGAVCDQTMSERAQRSATLMVDDRGSVPTAVVADVDGLRPGSEWFFCLVAHNEYGTSYGALASLTTPRLPSIVTEDVQDLTSTTAMLRGLVNPQGAPTTVWFRYDTREPASCDEEFGTRTDEALDVVAEGGDDDVVVEISLEGLAPKTTYWVCALAQSANGAAVGLPVAFETPAAAPLVTTLVPSSVTGRTALLSGLANARGAPTTAWFRVADDDPGVCDDNIGMRIPAEGGIDVGAGATPVPFSRAVLGLDPAVTYWVCAVAQNEIGIAWGEPQRFTTGVTSPRVTTEPARFVHASSAVLMAQAVPNGSPTRGWFRYDVEEPTACSEAFGTRIPAEGGSDLGSGTTPRPYATRLTGLEPNRRIWVCAVAGNDAGASFGAPRSFVTDSAVPLVRTLPARPRPEAVVLAGVVHPQGASTDAWFRYAAADPGACDDDFGTKVPKGGIDVGDGRDAEPVSVPVDELEPGTYWGCVLAQNDAGVARGELVRFSVPVRRVVVTDPAPAGCGTFSLPSMSCVVVFAAALGCLRRRRLRLRGLSSDR
jgi:hypothetical protein